MNNVNELLKVDDTKAKKKFSFRNIQLNKIPDIPIHINMQFIFWIYAIIIILVLPIIPSVKETFFDFYLSNYTKLLIIICATALFEILELLTSNFNKKIYLRNIATIDWAFAAFFILALISAICSDYSEASLLGTYGRNEGLLTILTYICIFKIFSKYFSFNTNFFKGMCITSSAISMYAIYQVTCYKYLYTNTYFNGLMGWSTMGNPNFLSAYLSMMLPLAIFAYMKSDKYKLQFLLVSIINFAGLVVAQTSSGYIAFIVYMTILLIYTIVKKMSFKKYSILIASFGIVFILLNILNNFSYISEFISIKENTYNSEEVNKIGNFRMQIYNIVLDAIKCNPVVGIGVDCLGNYTSTYYTKAERTINGSVGIIDKAHSEYLHIAVSYGIPALLTYIIAILLIASNLLKAYRKDTSNYILFAIGISIAIYLFQASVNIATIQVSPTFFALLGAGLSRTKKA